MYLIFFFLLWFFLDDIENTVLECLLVLAESVLLPRVVRRLQVEPVPSHALLKDAHHVLVIWVLFKLECSAVLHEFLELGGISFAKLLKRRLHLFLLDIVILFSFASPGKTLPRQTSSQEIQKNVAYSF